MSGATRPVVAALAMACALAVWSPAAQASPRIGWRACGAELQCARVAVPLDWANPAGRRISLAVIRHPASAPGPRRRTLFFNPGGPGVSGVAAVRAQAEALDAAGGGRLDVVSWDPRGTNASTAVRCYTSDAAASRFWGPAPYPTTIAASRAYVAKTILYDHRCGTLTGTALLSHVSTADTARDLERLRSLTGERTLTYLGWSYGSLIGETYANLFPRRVRAIVLDGVVDPVPTMADMETRVANNVSPTDAVFARFEALCAEAGPERCALAGHGMPAAARVDALLRRLRRGSLPAPTADPPGPLTYAEALAGVYGPLNGPAGWPEMAA